MIAKILPAMAVVSPGKPVVLYVNLTGDSIPAPFTDEHRYTFSPSVGKFARPGDQELQLTLPLPGSFFHGYPFRIAESPQRAPEEGNQYYFFVFTPRAEGIIELDGHMTLAQFDAGAVTGKVITSEDGFHSTRMRTEKLATGRARSPK